MPDDRGRIVQRHLEQCEPCRAVFRKLTADRFPRLRSYTVIARIGAGAFGEVFKVIHHVKQRTEALKLLYTETRFRTASFVNEVHAIARLRHPNIATLFDAQLAAPPLYYTMELVEGRQLDEHFRSPDVTLAERIEIFRQVALAMDYAHRTTPAGCRVSRGAEPKGRSPEGLSRAGMEAKRLTEQSPRRATQESAAEGHRAL